MKIAHLLKIEDNYLLRLLENAKKNEIRFNDRDYQLEDTVMFNVSERPSSLFSKYNPFKIGEEFYVEFEITHIHSGLGLQDGYVSLSLERVR